MDDETQNQTAPLPPLTLGQRLKLARRWSGLSLGQASRRLGCSRHSLKEAEEGDERRTWHLGLLKLCRLYAVRLEWLRGDKEEPGLILTALAVRLVNSGPMPLREAIEMHLAMVGPEPDLELPGPSGDCTTPAPGSP